MANRTGLGGTTLHYLAVWQAMVSVHRPVHLKITLTHSLTWQTDCCTQRRMAFKVLLNAKVALYLAYARLSPLYILSTLYVTHVMKYSRPSTTSIL